MNVKIFAGFLLSTFLILDRGWLVLFFSLIIVIGFSYSATTFLTTLVEDTYVGLNRVNQNIPNPKTSSKRRTTSLKVSHLIQTVISKIEIVRTFLFCNSNHSQQNKSSSACGTKIQDEIKIVTKLITQIYVKSWCDSLEISDKVVMKEGERILTTFLEKLSQEFLSRLNLESFLPELIDSFTKHLTDSWAENSGDSDDPALVISKIKDLESMLQDVVNDILMSCAPDDLNRIMKSPLEMKIPNKLAEKSYSAVYLMIQDTLFQGFILPVIHIISEPYLLNKWILQSFQSESEQNGLNKYSCDSFHELPCQGFECREDENFISNETANDVALVKRQTSNRQESQITTMDDKMETLKPFKQLYPLLRECFSSSNLIHFLSRQSCQTITEKSSPAKYSRPSLDQETGLEKGVDVSIYEEEHLFSNIRIPETRIMGPKGDHYISYRIVYDALFQVLETVASSKQTASCLVRQEISVSKRFSDFVSFHQKLESNPLLRPYVKSLENPSKMKTVSSMMGGASKLGRTVTSQRVSFLLRYLKVVIRLPVVSSSVELRSFLHYDHEAEDTAAGQSVALTSLTTLRFDRILSQGVREAVNLLKNVFPTDSYQEGGLATLFSGSNPLNQRQKIDTLYGAESLLTDSLLALKERKHLFRSCSDLTSSFDRRQYQPESSRLKWSLSHSDLNSIFQVRDSDIIPTLAPPIWTHHGSHDQDSIGHPYENSVSESIFNLVNCVIRKSTEPSLPSFLIQLFLEEFITS